MTDAPAFDLVLTRWIGAAPDKLFAAWTTPALMTQWFTPPPWKTVHAETDVRPGGASLVVMQGPNGEQVPHRGVYLEVVPSRRLVFTDAYTEAWTPSAKPFMTVVLSFDEEAGGTRYTARVKHWTQEDQQAHEQMGFHDGWGVATAQLARLVGAPEPKP